jgi:hypothetical protein
MRREAFETSLGRGRITNRVFHRRPACHHPDLSHSRLCFGLAQRSQW